MAMYVAPQWDLAFALSAQARIENLATLSGFDAFDASMTEPLLTEASRFIEDTIAPLNRTSDLQGAQWNDDNTVTTPDGFVEAYGAYVDSGWGALPFDSSYGGGGLPWVLNLAIQEMLNSACMSFALCPLLTQGAIDLLSHHASEEQKEIWLAKLISGEWSATMNLTESDAGSDVGAIRTRAEKQADGTYLISGQKIFITYGEHDLTENVIHLVLARTPDAPPGTKGISTFIVPKFLLDDEGRPSIRNDAKCTSIEHKLGINGSPTCTMQFGDEGRAVGYLIGEENRGMAYMFTMMNNARLSVGTQGLAIAERAYQDAADYARERRQGRSLGANPGASSPIIEHADVRRMLMTMKAYNEAMRGLVIANGAAIDTEVASDDDTIRTAASERSALLTPITKGWCTDIGCEVTSIAIQVHGGMGFIEETGVAQHFRDARINPIYEGTNGIQALDLVARKLPLDGGAVIEAFFSDIDTTIARATVHDSLASSSLALSEFLETARTVTTTLLERLGSSPGDVFASATPYLRLTGYLAGGWVLLEQASLASARLAAGDTDQRLVNKISTTRFYCEQLLPLGIASANAALATSDALFAVGADAF